MSYAVTMNIVNAHTGITFLVNPHQFVNLDVFKLWVQENLRIPKASLFLLAPFGVRFKFQMLSEGPEVYAFDKRLFSPDHQKTQVATVLREIQEDNAELVSIRPSDSPLLDSELTDLAPRQLQSKLVMNSGWSAAVLRDCKLINEAVTLKINEVNTLFKALNVIFQYYGNFCLDIENDFSKKREGIQKSQQYSLAQGWHQHYQTLKRIKLDAKWQAASSPATTLADLLNESELNRAAQDITRLYSSLNGSFKALKQQIDANDKDKHTIDRKNESLRNESIKNFRNFQQITTDHLTTLSRLVEAMQVDYKNIQHLNDAEIETIFRIHKTQHVAKISQSASQLYNSLLKLMKFKEEFLVKSVEILSLISNSQLKIVQVRDSLKSVQAFISELNVSEKALSHVVDMPLIYGFFMIESVRRKEWHGMLKGKTLNTAENFAVVNDQEREFRKKWCERFGVILEFLNLNDFNKDDDLLNVDLTITRSSLFNLNGEFLEITRDHVLRYIELLKEESVSTQVSSLVENTDVVSVLEKALADLDAKTLGLEEKDMTAEGDSEFVKGLKSRINKLESLLHQQNLNKYPMGKSAPKEAKPTWIDSLERQSLLFDGASMTAKTGVKNPKLDQSLLSRRHTFNSSSNPVPSKVYDSTNIDKHLENIKWKRDIAQSQEMLSKVLARNEEMLQRMEKMAQTLSEYKVSEGKLDEALKQEREKFDQILTARNDLEDKLRSKDGQIKRLEQRLAQKDTSAVEELRATFEAAKIEDTQKINALMFEKSVLVDQMAKINALYALEEGTKNDLLSRIAAAEERSTGEKLALEREIKSLQLQHKTDSEQVTLFRNLCSQHISIMKGMKSVIVDCFLKADILTRLLFKTFTDSCLILENIGLLLVMKDSIPTVIRVKGLKNKGKADAEGGDRPSTTFVSEAANHLNWFPLIEAVPLTQKQSSETESPLPDSDLSVVSEALKYIKVYLPQLMEASFQKFIRSVTFEDSDLLRKSITKRFGDVETLAKKLQKEIKTTKQEVQLTLADYSSKLSIKDFKAGDLVMFLPTREQDELAAMHDTVVVQPWAAFNVGAPHHFLKNDGSFSLSNRDWLLATIVSIHKFEVTTSNVDNLEQNPFKLSLGVTWFYVEAIEEESLL
ncbi:hypothetical protein BABINDRAFT_32944 [Babjeviella inositovora NRRL Y-12698]|uniref:Autophagy-related protein 11 n=1 Tax=Babjeviella inositovora NRRL Y-12698 TaxID=984486 RepID=A0A1E3QVN2_9ASCO|nr:uncharacterized protein BABINDRAFT_32944 [Babjeviella inositovora NRRL Y-12698]ODQ81718.1 hypothetical protein BABINDRAFT_32944 [Babjeviella inositovora NRRL Y-12698]